MYNADGICSNRSAQRLQAQIFACSIGFLFMWIIFLKTYLALCILFAYSACMERPGVIMPKVGI